MVSMVSIVKQALSIVLSVEKKYLWSLQHPTLNIPHFEYKLSFVIRYQDNSPNLNNIYIFFTELKFSSLFYFRLEFHIILMENEIWTERGSPCIFTKCDAERNEADAALHQKSHLS